MGLFGSLAKAGIAKKVFDEARKPHNQQKAKDLFDKMTSKRSKGGGARGTGSPGGRHQDGPQA